jgi:hypothetical protein
MACRVAAASGADEIIPRRFSRGFPMRNFTVARTGLAAALMVLAAPVMALCFQDQYGDQYHVSYDAVHQSYKGTLHRTADAGCDARDWTVMGAGRAKPGKMFALMAANPEDGGFCTDSYMLKGIYPNLSWFYPGLGYNAGEDATWSACGAQAVEGAPSAGYGGRR